MKKLLAIVLSLLMVMSLAVPAMAANDGSITINNTVKGAEYKIYKILDATTDGTGGVAYSIDSSSPWYDFVSTYKPTVEGANLFTLTQVGSTTVYNVALNTTAYPSLADMNDAVMVAFAEAALKKATDNSIVPTSTSSIVDNDGDPVVFSDLALGYYLVDSNVGVLCNLTTTKKTATINEKNGTPSVDKKVDASDDHASPDWKDSNDAKIGDTVYYQATINVAKGTQRLQVTDTMEAGLTFNQGSLSIKVNGADVATENYTVTDKTDRGFKIDFTEAYITNLAKSDAVDIVLTYDAVLNKDAEIESATNDNTISLKYGHDFEFDGGTDTVTTKTFEFDILKYTGDEAPYNALKDAKFKLYDALTGGNEIRVYLVSAGNNDNAAVYRVCDSTNYDSAVTEIVTPESGKIQIEGLDSKTYYLEETEAPAGYNKLTAREAVDLTGATNKTGITIANPTDGTTGVGIKNNSGSKLPETGGIGTTIFYVVGGLMMAVAVVLLVTKKKVNGK